MRQGILEVSPILPVPEESIRQMRRGPAKRNSKTSLTCGPSRGRWWRPGWGRCPRRECTSSSHCTCRWGTQSLQSRNGTKTTGWHHLSGKGSGQERWQHPLYPIFPQLKYPHFRLLFVTCKCFYEVLAKYRNLNGKMTDEGLGNTLNTLVHDLQRTFPIPYRTVTCHSSSNGVNGTRKKHFISDVLKLGDWEVIWAVYQGIAMTVSTTALRQTWAPSLAQKYPELKRLSPSTPYFRQAPWVAIQGEHSGRAFFSFVWEHLRSLNKPAFSYILISGKWLGPLKGC